LVTISTSDAELLHDAHRQRHLLHGIAFVVVKAPLHHTSSNAGDFADHQPPGVPGDGADGKVRNLGVGNNVGVGKLGGEPAQPAAQDQPDARLVTGAAAHKGGRLGIIG
jgi:hypothetical protein